MTQEYIANAKELAEKQYSEANELGSFDDCIGFPHNGQYIVNPWMDSSGRFELTTEEAISIYGTENFEYFCKAITRDNNARKVQGYDNSPVRHTGII